MRHCALPFDAPGAYTLTVALVKPESPNMPLYLGLADRRVDGSYPVAAVTVAQSATVNGLVYSDHFAQTLAGWDAANGLTLSPDGDGGLRCSGEEAGKAWSYASCYLSKPLLPYSRYRLSCG